jgi:Cellulase (glycosyl hydrolase family 5)
MSLRTALPAQPTAGTRSRIARASFIAALSAVGCTDPRPEIIASFPPDANVETGPGAGGAMDAGDAGSTPLPVPAQRGRVKVVAGDLVTDRGTPLRGLLLPVDTSWALGNYAFDIVTTIAQTTGLNTLHVYLEDTQEDSGSMEATADALVSMTASAGLYLIIAHGTGTAIDTFDSGKIKSFWDIYAKRYANKPHVLFEIQNNPEATCSKNVLAATLAMEEDTYSQIRALAPDSHIMLFSTTSLIQPSVFNDAVMRLGTKVNWSNASFGMDVTMDCVLLPNLLGLTSAAKTAGVPILIGQLPPTGWGPYITAFEQAKLGWMQYQWFATDTQLTDYASTTTAQGASWCPDQGTFPEDSSSCQ